MIGFINAISSWNPVLVVALFLVLPIASWWVFQTAYQNRWIKDREGFKWSRVFRSLRKVSAVFFAAGSVIVSIIGAMFVADVFRANSETVLPLIMFVALIVAGFYAAAWSMDLAFNSVHSRYPEEYDRNSKSNGLPSYAGPYRKKKAALRALSLCVTVPVALITVIVIGIGIVAIVGSILSALGIFLAMPDGITVPTIAAVIIIGFFMFVLAVFGL